MPPDSLQQQITTIKQELSQRYQSKHALNAPPHITVFPPFRWPQETIHVFDCLSNFCRNIAPCSVQLDGFGAFPPRVIFVRPERTSDLIEHHKQLQVFMQQAFNLVDPMAHKRAYIPHITVAHKDLSPQSFMLAWEEYEVRSFKASFIATHLTLLQHHGKRWDVIKEWPFNG